MFEYASLAIMLRRRWPLASKILLALAVLLGASTFVIVRGYQERADALRSSDGATSPVVVAAIDLARGTVLSESVLRAGSLPTAYLPPGAISDMSSIAGRTLTAAIVEGEIVTASRLAAPHTGPIAALVPAGLRAVVIPAGVPAGTISAGDRVDVFATFGGGRPHTELAAGEIEVLKVLTQGSTDGLGGAAAGSSEAGSSLVVLADTDAAERLAYARTFAQLTVAIVGPDPATGTS
jgi:pilus assembly protein CpaB